MTHFAVAVISDGTKTFEELLAPYDEENEACYTFVDCEEDTRKKWENDTTRRIRTADGDILSPWDDKFRRSGTIGYGSDTHFVPVDAEEIEIPLKVVYPSYERFAAEYMDYIKDPDTGHFGYMDNKNAKWDWYELGGRYRGSLKAAMGELGKPSWTNKDDSVPDGSFDKALIADIDFSPSQEEYDKAIEYWNTHDSDPWFNKEKWDNDPRKYAEFCSLVGWRAVITPDGVWHEVGETGWFGYYGESIDEKVEWYLNFYDRFIKPQSPDCTLAVYDCHI